MAPWCVAGIDAGTTVVKGATFTQDGARVRESRRPVETRDEIDGFDADAIAATIKAVADELWPFAAIAISGVINTHLLVDAHGRALTPAIPWNDHRARAHEGAGWTATSVVARVAHWRVQEPEALAAARWVMVPRDYAILQMTGHACTERTAWPDLIDHRRLSQRVPDAVRRLLPPLQDPAAVVASYRDVPLVAGCMDSLASALGAGPTPPGTGIDVGGTSETAGVIAPGEDHRPSVRGAIEVPEGWWHGGPTQAGGRAITWAAGLMTSGDSDRLVRLAERAPREPTGVIFLPYLEGERAPLWDPDARACFIGLTAADTPAVVARSVFEGVAFAVRHVVESSTPPGTRADHLVICGGPSASALWDEIKADVTGLESFVPDEAETGARGAAMLAATGLTGRPLADVRAALEPTGTVIRPDPANAERYASLYESYVRLWPAIRDQM